MPMTPMCPPYHWHSIVSFHLVAVGFLPEIHSSACAAELLDQYWEEWWSGWVDLNHRPLRPERSALPC